MPQVEEIGVKISKQDFLPQWTVILNGTPLSPEASPKLVVVRTKAGNGFRVSEEEYLELEFYGSLIWVPFHAFTVIADVETYIWEFRVPLPGKSVCWLMPKESEDAKP